MLNFFDDVKVLDLSSKLPGPMGSYLLAQMGAVVTKLEDKNRPDEFAAASGVIANFKDWYDNLNAAKRIKKIDYNQDLEIVYAMIGNADITLIPSNSFYKKIITNAPTKPKVIIEISGDKAGEPMHDLNAIGQTNTIKLQTENHGTLPYLPFAGINYGQFIALTASCALRKAEQNNKTQHQIVYLSEATKLVFDALDVKSKETRFLHNGAFPCYNIYESADGVALFLAAIEERYWLKLNELFNLNLTLEDRFDTSNGILDKLKKTFEKYTSHEIRELIKDNPICLTLGQTIGPTKEK